MRVARTIGMAGVLVGLLAVAACEGAVADSRTLITRPARANQLPGPLGASLPGFEDIIADSAGTPPAALPDRLAAAPFLGFDGRSLRFYEDGDDDFTAYDPLGIAQAATASESADFWRGRFRPIFVKLLRRPGARALIPVISLRFAGLLTTTDEGDSYRRIFSALPKRSTPASVSSVPLYRDVLDLWQNPRRPDEIVLLNKYEVLFTADGGQSFRKYSLKHGDLDNATLNVVTGSVDEDGNIREVWVGTYLNGIARCVPRVAGTGGAWSSLDCRPITSRGLPALVHEKGTHFVEEISGLTWDGARGLLLSTSRFQAALNVLDARRAGATHTSYPLPGFTGSDHAESLFYDRARGMAYVSTNRGLYVFSIEERAFRHVPRKRLFGGETGRGLEFFGAFWDGEGRVTLSEYVGPDASGRSPGGPDRFGKSGQLGRAPSNVRALYVSPTSARSKQRTVFDLLDRYNFNAAVIDVKDDLGRLIYGSKLAAAREMNNARERADIRGLVKKLKERGVYTIARQVVFKDRVLFNYQNHRYAIRDRAGGPWVTPGEEQWVDTHSEWVHDYNVQVAQELVALGFDEIQFDYIRFPSDGPIGRCRWSYRIGDAYKSEALENFLMKARRNLSRPISVDVYGYHGIYRAGTVIGQDLIDLGEFVDVVSPMHYSSHFGNRYLDHHPKESRAYELLKLGTERPLRMGQGRFQVRPWVQAFKMKIALWGWGEPYMRNQMLGSVHGGASGFLWWGPLREFYLPGRVQNELVKNGQ